MMKELMELIKQKMIASVKLIDQFSLSTDHCASLVCLNLARIYEILNSLDKKTTEPIATINSAEELSDKHWEECRQIAHYDDQLKKALKLLRGVTEIHSTALHSGGNEVSTLTGKLMQKIRELENEIAATEARK